MKIGIASDHGGYELKEYLIKWLTKRDCEVFDLGCYSKDSVDYPVYGNIVGQSITQGEFDYGIIICGTGIGINIAANRYPSVRAALCYDLTTARLSREHNDANVLALGARQTAPELAREIVSVFLSTEFDGNRHQSRVSMLSVEPDRLEEYKSNILKTD